MTESVERIAVLEAEVRAMKEHQDEILKAMLEIRDEMTKYKGFLGGIAFIISCLGVALTLFKDWIIEHILR